jgi:hypothetical protein
MDLDEHVSRNTRQDLEDIRSTSLFNFARRPFEQSFWSF